MKYWITYLNQGSVKSPYAVRLNIVTPPENEEEITKWLTTSFGKFGHKIVINDNAYSYAEIYLKNESDISSFILRWGESLNDKEEKEE